MSRRGARERQEETDGARWPGIVSEMGWMEERERDDVYVQEAALARAADGVRVSRAGGSSADHDGAACSLNKEAGGRSGM